ncbi:hypothetical protein NITMOv2_2971 [Nitrospira moscoviensis]|uniref:Uncharacterized protein n=1 Tax=Nitrospira moscoviensis TaxID=42253 RepID=A0A0K2GEJ6_NITMO|nr:hypothetical protein NITMOv2_2971 [Nitrospira moscoviensis]
MSRQMTRDVKSMTCDSFCIVQYTGAVQQRMMRKRKVYSWCNEVRKPERREEPNCLIDKGECSACPRAVVG